MAFKTIGKIDVTVTEAFIADPRFPEKPGELNGANQPVGVYADVCLMVSDAEGHSDIWRGELSNRTGRGNLAGMYQTDITIKRLQEIGFGVTTLQELYAQCQDTPNGTMIPNLAGKEATVTTTERTYEGRDGQQHTIIQIAYLNARGQGGPTRLSMHDFAARLGLQQTPPAPPAPAFQQPVQQTPQQMFSQPGQPTGRKNKTACPY